jgi:hypothetical protein
VKLEGHLAFLDAEELGRIRVGDLLDNLELDEVVARTDRAEADP